MINGAHITIFSRDAEADRAFFKEYLEFASVDAGDGWLIFALPPSEVAFHPSDNNNQHQFYLICENIHEFLKKMALSGVKCSKIKDEGWGLLSSLTLPGGGTIGFYQPMHNRPIEKG
jgi:hypothetical protein